MGRVGRRWAQRQLRPVARDGRSLRHVVAAARSRAERPGRAAGQQFDRAIALLFRRHGQRRDALHHPRRDESQPARQYFRAAQAEAHSVSGRPAARRSVGGNVRAAVADRAVGQSRDGNAVRRTCALRAGRSGASGAARRRRHHPVHLGHQRAAQGRGAEFPRISAQHRSARRRLGYYGGRPALRFSPVLVELGADLGRADHRQPRRHAGSGRKILGQPFFPASARSWRDHRRRQSDDDQYSAQQRTKRAPRQPCQNCALSPRARRRSWSKSGNGSSRNSELPWRKAAAPAR